MKKVLFFMTMCVFILCSVNIRADIPKLINPILKGEADIVIGDRQTDKIPHFSSTKKKLQKIGSLVVRFLSNTDVPDAVSGFRAFSREAAMQTNVVSYYSYTIETVIQAGAAAAEAAVGVRLRLAL